MRKEEENHPPADANPCKQNFSILDEFTTNMGRIKASSLTGLRPPNQRKMAKAIRRAIGMGIAPSVHKHPEIMEWEYNNNTSPNSSRFI